VGGYDDWLRQSRGKSGTPVAPGKVEERKAATAPPREKQRKLSFKEQKELDDLPKRIEALDAEQQKIIATMADPAFYRESGNNVASTNTRLANVEKELAEAYKRWNELEAMKG
jgi:ATP-binding cassette subfamily F protein uup